MWICPKCATHVQQDELRNCPNCKATRSRDTTTSPPAEDDDIPLLLNLQPIPLPDDDKYEIPLLSNKWFTIGFLGGTILGIISAFLIGELKGTFLSAIVAAVYHACIFGFLGGFVGWGIGLSVHLLRSYFLGPKLRDSNAIAQEDFTDSVLNHHLHPDVESDVPNENIQTDDGPRSTDLQP
jgi:hypothetical protein